jgi:diguanylate cyclase (GGDEF)-like protein
VGFPRLSNKWTGIVCAIACVHVGVSLLARPSLGLAAFGDLLQCALLLCATLATLSNIGAKNKREQIFWSLLALGCGMWLCAQALWTYFEVFLRQETPNPFIGDVILFLHIVPMMAAMAVRPNARPDGHSMRLGTLDFFLLLTWWLYLYLFIVIPWQYVAPNEAIYGSSFDLLYACEQVVLIFAAVRVWRNSTGHWRTIYSHLIKAALLYIAGSLLASVAIDFHRYYTGSLFDIPLVAAMGWFAVLGLTARELTVNSAPAAPAREQSMWTARLAMTAVFSTPLMIAWAQFSSNAPPQVRSFRLLLTVAAMVFMGTLVFLKQHWMDRELLHLLHLSRQNLEEMRALKDELQSKEQSLRWHSLELQRKNLELQEISYTDALTGIWNRRYLEEILTAEAAQVLRNYERAGNTEVTKLDHRDLTFLMVDVDFFKQVNDQHGHPAGDRLLQLVAERLGKVVRKSDVLVRWGGEEFLIMSRSADAASAPAFCERILDVMTAGYFDLGHGVQVRKTCSVGWASFPWSRHAYEAICAEEVIELADTALYLAKAAGRNQGIGILPSEAITAAHKIILHELQQDKGILTKTIPVKHTASDNVAAASASTEKPSEKATV